MHTYMVQELRRKKIGGNRGMQKGVWRRRRGGQGRKTGGGGGGEREAVMCLRSFSISTEVLFIRLKSSTPLQEKKTMGKY